MGGKSGKKVTVGYKYYMGGQVVLGHGPWDKISLIRFDDRDAWTGTATGGSITINAPELFGGEKREGGIQGTVDVEMGYPSQAANSYLVSAVGSDVPAYRGIVTLILRRIYMGMNPYFKALSVVGTRIQVTTNGETQWYPTRATISDDMNPAHIIRECITDRYWGMGANSSEVGASFAATADKLHAENFGLSFYWSETEELEEFVLRVLEHIEGTLYVDRMTGMFELTLARDDYDPDAIPAFGPAQIVSVDNYQRRTAEELVNQVTVKFWDKTTLKDSSVTVQDIALIQEMGVSVGAVLTFSGVTTAELATRIASRELRQLSTALASCSIQVNRSAARNVHPGDVIKISWPPFGITAAFFRVVIIDLGELGDETIKIDLLEDIFSLGSALYAPPPGSQWEDPKVPPTPSPFHCMIEAPYYELAQRVGDEAAQGAYATTGFFVISAVRPGQGMLNASLFSNQGAGMEEVGTMDFCPTALLVGAVGPTQTTFTITSGIDTDLIRVGSYAVLGPELVRIDSVTLPTITVGRGCLDTVPAKSIASGTRFFFADDYFETDGTEYDVGEVARAKVLPISSLGMLDISLATEQTVTIQARQKKPYAPGQFRLNGVAYPATIAGNIDIVVTWAHRDRISQTTAAIVDTTAGNIGPEAGTTYSMELRDASNVLITSQTGISGTTHTITQVAMGANYGNLTLTLWSVRDGIASWQKHDWTFERLT